MSDLHFEWHDDGGRAFVDGLDPAGVDTLIVAGDLAEASQLTEALRMLLARYPRVVFVPGNHEYYHASPTDLMRVRDEVWSLPGLSWLDCDIVEIGGVRFLGATLWFEHYADRSNYINDFDYIDKLVPWVYEQNRRAQEFLRREMRRGDVVVTHHLPSYNSVDPQFVAHPGNRFFVCDVERVVADKQPALFVHGHTHASRSYRIGETHVVCNPLGRPNGEKCNRNFDDKLVLEVGS